MHRITDFLVNDQTNYSHPRQHSIVPADHETQVAIQSCNVSRASDGSDVAISGAIFAACLFPWLNAGWLRFMNPVCAITMIKQRLAGGNGRRRGRQACVAGVAYRDGTLGGSGWEGGVWSPSVAWRPIGARLMGARDRTPCLPSVSSAASVPPRRLPVQQLIRRHRGPPHPEAAAMGSDVSKQVFAHPKRGQNTVQLRPVCRPHYWQNDLVSVRATKQIGQQ